MRAFIAITLPTEIKSSLTKTIEALKPCSADAKWTPQDNLHITLKFLADITDAQFEQIKKHLTYLAQEAKPFQASLEGFSFMPDDTKPRVFCASASAKKEMAQLAQAIENILSPFEFVKKEGQFQPHITLAKMKSLYNLTQLKDSLKGIKLSGEFSVSGVSIIKSTLTATGAIYEVIQEFPFNAI
jgi:RNA 2',3'-cyclic 3'-phosphodiesterase